MQIWRPKYLDKYWVILEKVPFEHSFLDLQCRLCSGCLTLLMPVPPPAPIHTQYVDLTFIKLTYSVSVSVSYVTRLCRFFTAWQYGFYFSLLIAALIYQCFHMVYRTSLSDLRNIIKNTNCRAVAEALAHRPHDRWWPRGGQLCTLSSGSLSKFTWGSLTPWALIAEAELQRASEG